MAGDAGRRNGPKGCGVRVVQFGDVGSARDKRDVLEPGHHHRHIIKLSSILPGSGALRS